MTEIMVPPTSKANLEQYALQIRHQLGLDDVVFVPVISVIEKRISLLLDSSFNYEYVPTRDLPLEYAHYNPISNLLTIREDVYFRACEGSPRDRFTIAHEIGHFCLHSNGVILSRAQDRQRIPAYRNPEWQANTFASFFLMPQHLIRGMSPKEIAKKFGTSYQAATIALESRKR